MIFWFTDKSIWFLFPLRSITSNQPVIRECSEWISLLDCASQKESFSLVFLLWISQILIQKVFFFQIEDFIQALLRVFDIDC